MADIKISNLPAATTPLAGTEVLPIVQSGTTKKVAVSDLTAGRAVSTQNLEYTGTLTGSTGVIAIGTNQIYKDAGGNVGVGTAMPAYKLEVAGAISTNNNLTFTGTENRITGDFSNATFASRVAFQTSTVNGATRVAAIPNGTSTAAEFLIHNNSDPNNSGIASLRINASDLAITSGITGTGTYVPIVLSTGGGERVRVDTSGNVGIGTSSPTSGGKLDVNGIAYFGTNDKVKIYSNNVLQSAGTLDVGTIGNSVLNLITNNSTKATIDSSGNLLVGVTTVQDGSRLQVRGSGDTSGTKAFLVEDSGGNDDFFIRGDGEMYSLPTYNRTSGSAANVGIDSSGGFFRSTSSLKYKTDVNDAIHGLTELLTLRPVTYKGNSDGDTVFGGLIAEEVHEAGLTEFVQYADDGSPDALAYGNMVSLCIKAIQEQQTLIQDLTTRLSALEAK